MQILLVVFLFSCFILCVINVYEARGGLGKENMELKRLFKEEIDILIDGCQCLHSLSSVSDVGAT